MSRNTIRNTSFLFTCFLEYLRLFSFYYEFHEKYSPYYFEESTYNLTIY